MHHWSIRRLLQVVMIVLIVIISLAFTVLLYNSKSTSLLRGIDDQLLTAAFFTRALLPTDYHDRITDASSVSPAAYDAIVTKYNGLCSRLNLQYVWSVLEVNGEIVFTSGTATSKEIKNGDYARFFERHTDPAAFTRALQTMQPDYSTFRNKWGHGRMVLVPDVDARGRKFIFGASISLSEVDTLLQRVLIKSLLLSLCILVLGSLLAYHLANGIARPISQLQATAQRIAAGEAVRLEEVTGSAEVASLSRSIRTMHDVITARMTELQTHRRDLQVTLDSIGDGVIATDAQGNITRMNRIAQLLTGWETADAVGRPLAEVFNIINADTREPVENPVTRVLREGCIVGLANSTLLITRAGTERQIADSAAPITLDGQTEIHGVVLVFRDVTEKYQLEAQLRQTQKMESIGRLAGGIAHDFNNILCGITGYASLLATALAGDSTLGDHARHIQNAADRAAALTQKLLTFTRQRPTHVAPLNLHQALTDVMAIFRQTVDRRIVLVPKLDAEHIVIQGDVSEVHSALLNLLLNARDAMPEGGEIRISTANDTVSDEQTRLGISTQVPGDYLVVNITDTGMGIAPHLREKIFDPFFTTKEVGAGTGLGLASVYATVKECGGSISVYSQVGKGTTFTLRFPVSTLPVAQALTAAGTNTPGSGTLLLVDDEPVLRELGTQILTSLGYRVLLAEDGADAVTCYQAHWQEIDCVILDVVMPKLSGPDTLQQIRDINPHARVLLSSGYTHDARIDRLLDDGLTGFLPKPFTHQELSAAVARVIAARHEARPT
jgi:PAS domain S-box-containing protein